MSESCLTVRNISRELPWGLPLPWVVYIIGFRYIAIFSYLGGCCTLWYRYQAAFDDYWMRLWGQPWGTREHIIWGFCSWQRKLGMGHLVKIYWGEGIWFSSLGLSVNTNHGVTQKTNNLLKGIRNPIPRKLYNPLYLIRNLVPKIIWSQWLRGLTVPT